MEIRYWAGTDVGRKRAANEDNFLIDKQLKLFVVADGMGGHASGEIASAMAVHGIRDVIASERDILDAYDDDDPKSHVEVCTLLEYAVHETCERIFLKARQEPEKRGMGTTLVALLIIGARGFIAYVGDSRIYLLRGGVVYQLTEDHSLRNELIRMGKITAEEFEDSPYANLKNAMTRAVGVYEHVEVDTLDFDVIPGDSFLLCSDGLYEYLDDSDIANTIGLPDIREVPGTLIDHANTRGGKDNITAVVVQVGGEDLHDRAAELNLTLDTLGQVPIFGDLSYQQLVRILNLARQMPMQAGQTVFAEGDEGNELFVVLRGRIELSRGGVVVTELGEGAHLGEMALIDASPRSTTGRALEDGKLLAIARDDFYQILRREPPLAVKLLLSFLQILAKRLRQTTADLADARTTALQLPDLTDALADATATETVVVPAIAAAAEAPVRRRSSTERALPAQPDLSPPPSPEAADSVEEVVELEEIVDVTQIAPAPTPHPAATLAPPPAVGPPTRTGPVPPVIAPSPPTVTAPVKTAPAAAAEPVDSGGDIGGA
jgi:PPM family protein phosphatase